MANIPNIRVGNTVLAHARLKDGGVAVPWSDFSNIRVSAYSVEQRMIATRCTAAVSQSDAEVLDVTYHGDEPQYLGVCKFIVRADYQGRTKTYDVPVVNFVAETAAATGVTVVTDPEVSVVIEAQDVSTSVLDEAIAAALAAADKADAAAEHAPYIDETTGNWFVWDADEGTYVDTEVHAQGPQGLTGPRGPQGQQGEKGDKGDKGDTGAKGEKGDKGDTGAQGPAGQDGQQGPQGPAGSDASVTKTNIESALGYTPANDDTAARSFIIIGSVDDVNPEDYRNGDFIGIKTSADSEDTTWLQFSSAYDEAEGIQYYQLSGFSIGYTDDNVVVIKFYLYAWDDGTGEWVEDENSRLVKYDELNSVALSGSYNDLTDKPNIPPASPIVAGTGRGSAKMAGATAASGNDSLAEGGNTSALGNNAHAEGYGTIAYENQGHAEGNTTIAVGKSSHAEGTGTAPVILKKGDVPVMATGTEATGDNPHVYTMSVVEDNVEVATADHGLEVGTEVKVGNKYACVIAVNGATVTFNQTLGTVEAATVYTLKGAANGSAAHSEGRETVAGGNYAHSEGYQTTATGGASHTEGRRTAAPGSYAHAEGNSSTASGESSHAEGHETLAGGNYSHAEGKGDIKTVWLASVSGTAYYAAYSSQSASKATAYAFAVGDIMRYNGNLYTAIELANEGKRVKFNTDLLGTISERVQVEIIKGYAGAYCHVEGDCTIANNGHAEGRNNMPVPDAVHTVGVGTEKQRKNAHLITVTYDELDEEHENALPHHYIPGIGGYTGTEYDLTGKQDLATVVNAKADISGATGLRVLTVAAYNALGTKDANTLYFTKES